MKQKDKLLKLVRNKPGLTATSYTRLLGFPVVGNVGKFIDDCNPYYKPATILRELHRFVEKGILERKWLYSDRSQKVRCWRFYPSEIF